MRDEIEQEIPRVLLDEIRDIRRVLEERLPPDVESDSLLDKRAVANYLGVSLRTVDRFLAEGRLPIGRRVGRFQRWTREEVLDAFSR